MNTLFLILFLLCIFVLIVGLIKPSALVKKEEVPTRKKILTTLIPLMLVFFVLFGFTTDDSSKQAKSTPTSDQTKIQPQPQSPEPPKTKTIYSLSLKPDEFKDRFNQAAQRADMKIVNINIENGEIQNTFNNKITNNISIVGVINKGDNSIRSITMIGTGDGTLKSGADIFITIGLLISSANPEIPPDERFNILQDIGLTKKGENALTKGNLIRYGRKYSFSISEVTGVWFTISDPNDK